MGRSHLQIAIGVAVLLLLTVGTVLLVIPKDNPDKQIERGEVQSPGISTKEYSILSRFKIQKEIDESRGIRLLTEDGRKEEPTYREGNDYFNKGPQVLNQIMEQEEIDEVWTREVFSAAEKIFQKEEYKGTSLKEIECRETLCHMILEHSNEAAFEYFKRNGVEEKPWEGDQIGVHRHIGGSMIESDVYFSDPSGDPEPFRIMQAVLKNEE